MYKIRSMLRFPNPLLNRFRQCPFLGNNQAHLQVGYPQAQILMLNQNVAGLPQQPQAWEMKFRT